ncbi:MAG: hypothetical protein JSV69_06980 [Chloroflexota bacterium]|nr:MAG: hypothetical protein JSV69_06980 [Chloroflexota bacterium]
MSKLRLARFLIGFGLCIIVITLGFLYYQQVTTRISIAPLPKALASFSIKKNVLGRSALDELSWLHDQEFQLNKGAVGTYGKGHEITLYVAGTPISFMAGRLLAAMHDKIARSETPFTPVAEREYKGRIVYELQGMGQQHFYFRSNGLVVWLAVDKPHAEQALRQVLEFYP